MKDGLLMVVRGSFTGQYEGRVSDGCQGLFTGQYEGRVSDGCQGVVYRAVEGRVSDGCQGCLQGSAKEGFQMVVRVVYRAV